MSDVMVWIDKETTGLDSELDVPMELGLIITDSSLNILAEWSSPVRHEQWQVRFDESVDWVRETHTKSGLVAEILALPDYRRTAGVIRGWQPYYVALEACLFLAENNVPEGLPMCGSSVHFDRRFLERYMPVLHNRFSYRNIDVSTVTELCKLFNPELYARCQEIPEFDKANAGHRVISDLRYSIKKLRFWMDEFLIASLPYPEPISAQPMIYGLDLTPAGKVMLASMETGVPHCPTCGSHSPRLHPAIGGGGEVTSICQDDFHRE